MKNFIYSLLLVVPLIACAQSKPDPKSQPKMEKNQQVEIETSMGNIVVELDSRTPITTQNFLSYVDQGYYTGTIFHRVISSFMIQGGGMTKDLKKKTTPPPATFATE